MGTFTLSIENQNKKEFFLNIYHSQSFGKIKTADSFFFPVIPPGEIPAIQKNFQKKRLFFFFPS